MGKLTHLYSSLTHIVGIRCSLEIRNKGRTTRSIPEFMAQNLHLSENDVSAVTVFIDDVNLGLRPAIYNKTHKIKKKNCKKSKRSRITNLFPIFDLTKLLKSTHKWDAIKSRYKELLLQRTPGYNKRNFCHFHFAYIKALHWIKRTPT